MKETFTVDPEELKKLPEETRLAVWFLFGDTGISSETIAAVMTGACKFGRDLHGNSTPRDVYDFARCSKLLDLFPEWRKRISEVGKTFPHWAPLCSRWEQVETAYAAIRHLDDKDLWNRSKEGLHELL